MPHISTIMNFFCVVVFDFLILLKILAFWIYYLSIVSLLKLLHVSLA